MFTLLNKLRNYKPTNLDKRRERKETLNNAEMLYNSRNNVIKAFFFHLKMDFKKKSQMCLMKHYHIG